MLARLPVRLLWFLAVFATLTALTERADAQTITVNRMFRQRDTDRTQLPNGINIEDCLTDNGYRFGITVVGTPSNNLEVWVAPTGTNCADSNIRNTQQLCGRVFIENILAGPATIDVSAQDVALALGAPDRARTPGAGTAQDCSQPSAPVAPTAFSFWFMFANIGQIQGTAIEYTGPGATTTSQLQYDLRQPSAPRLKEAGAGEDRIVLKWDTSSASDRAAYQFFCFPSSTDGPVDGGAADAGEAGIPDATPDGEAPDADTDADTDADAASISMVVRGGGDLDEDASDPDPDPDPDPDADGGTDTDTGSGAPPGRNDACPAPPFESEESTIVQLERYRCGRSDGQSARSGEARTLNGQPLTNGQNYAVAVATIDRAGNVGGLSNIQCATPQLVKDFFEAYREAGGEGGGGFCTIGTGQASGALAFVVGALVMRIVRRRRAR